MYKSCCATTSKINLAFDKKKTDKVKAAFDNAARYMHGKGSFTSKDLKNKAVNPLIKATFEVLKDAIETGIKTVIPDEMMQMLKEDVFVFSGMKTYTQLKEASLLLRDETGNVKSVTKFIYDVKQINETYNENYLRVEHQYAISASQSAAQWKEWEKDGDRYYLQFRTAQDDKVRTSHAVLHNITLPMSDPFWKTNMTPLDWGCRCRVIQVLKSKYEVSDSDNAVKLGDKATGEIFKYNPGIDQVIFPPKHPYFKMSNEAKKEVKKIKQDGL